MSKLEEKRDSLQERVNAKAQQTASAYGVSVSTLMSSFSSAGVVQDKMFFEGVGITEMAVILQRSETAIIQQIEKMNLYDRRLYPARQKSCSAQSKCLCGTCMADPALCPLRRGGRCCQEGE